MSSDCIYKQLLVRVPAEQAAQPEDQFILITLVGASNCYDWSNRRARSWQIAAVGNRQAIIADAIYSGSGFEGGMTYFGNFGKSGALEPEYYIAKVRRMLDRAQELDSNFSISCGNTPLRLKARNGGTLDQSVLQAAFQDAAQDNEPYRNNPKRLLAVEGPSY